MADSSNLTLHPLESHQLATSNGTAMVLSLVNSSDSNVATYAVACTPIGFSDEGTLAVEGQKLYDPMNYQGNPLGVANTTNPNKPADIEVFLGQLGAKALDEEIAEPRPQEVSEDPGEGPK